MELVINISDINKGIKSLEQFKALFDRNVEKYTDRMTDIGVKEASRQFQSARYDGFNDVYVSSLMRSRNESEIEATGESVLFIEFGTGIRYAGDASYGIQYGLGPGTWSEGPQGMGHWDDPKGWYYGHNKRSWGNPANRCMYNARKEMAFQALRVAREVFI